MLDGLGCFDHSVPTRENVSIRPTALKCRGAIDITTTAIIITIIIIIIIIII